MWWFIYYRSFAALCWGLLRHRGAGGDPELLTSFLWVPSHSPFSSFCRATVCPSLKALCVSVLSVCLSLSLPVILRLHGVKERWNDSSSLEQERPTTSPSYSLCFLWPAFCCSGTSLSSALMAPLSLCLFSDPNALGQHGTDHALIGGVVAVVVFVTLCLIIVLGRYLARHKGKSTAEPTWFPRGWWRQHGMLCFSLKTCEVFPQIPKVYNTSTATILVCEISYFTHQYGSISARTRLVGGIFVKECWAVLASWF